MKLYIIKKSDLRKALKDLGDDGSYYISFPQEQVIEYEQKFTTYPDSDAPPRGEEKET